MVHYEDQTFDLEAEDRVETILIGLRYTGPKSSVSASTPRENGGWPGKQTFQGGPVTDTNEDGKPVAREPGPIQLGINPDWVDSETVDGGSLAGLEALPDFEVIYDPERLATAMLEQNFLPPVVFGTPSDAGGGGQRISPVHQVRERVFEQLGLNDIGSGPGSHDEYRSQLADLAGIDDSSDEVPADKQRQQTYLDDHSRSDLKEAAERLAPSAADDLSGKHDLAEFLAEQPAGDVRAAFNGDLDNRGPDNAADEDAEGTSNEDWNEDDWLDRDYQDRASAVRDGEVDAHLDAVEACETSATVEDAVEDRREELHLDA